MQRASKLSLLLVLLFATLGRAETWETNDGKKFEGRISAVYGPLVLVSGKSGSMLRLVQDMKDDELVRVADHVATQPAKPAAWSTSTSKVAKALKGRLQRLRDGKLVDFEVGERPEPDFYLVYFGANWCGPCRAFSPKFVSEYAKLKMRDTNRFEAVFVSNDRSASEQLQYVQHAMMPWPVLKYSQLGRAEVIERWAGNGIPCLVVLTREGDLVFHSYHGDEYVGPGDVLERFESLLNAMDAGKSGHHPAMHRLATIQYLRAAGTGNKPVAPYVITFDPRRYRTLEVKEMVATLDIDEKGTVQNASIEPELPAVLNYQLVNDAEKWLFLPAVQNGKAIAQKVKLPLTIAMAGPRQ